jgi:hypothetical protein
VNLATYGWFPISSSEGYISSQQTQAQWKKAAMTRIQEEWSGALPATETEIEPYVRSCIELQLKLGCEALIIPGPLTLDYTSDYSRELMWLDSGLSISAEVSPNLPIMATVALSDTCLRGIRPWENPLLDIVIDQVTARCTGVYLVIESANENGYYITHRDTVGALLRLVRSFKQGGVQRVFVNFAGVAGLMAAGVGADAWSSGWYRGERRLKLADFEDEMGLAVPTYYSHRLASEIHLDKDLDRIVKRGYLERLVDVTDASAGLITALRSGRGAASVAEWRYGKSNVQAAIGHFLAAAIRDTRQLKELDANARLERTSLWLEEADRLASLLFGIGSFNQRTELMHPAVWLSAWKEFMARSN